MPTLPSEEARHRFLSSRVASLATVSAAGHPHLVPMTFAPASPDRLVSAVDHKPKRTSALARLENISANPNVALLVDRYDDDWTQLWWSRADGHAEILAPGIRDGERERALLPLIARYEQYSEHPPAGPVILITVVRWSGWQFTVPR